MNYMHFDSEGKGRDFEFISEVFFRSLGWSVLRNVIFFDEISLSTLRQDNEIDLVAFKDSDLIVCSCKSGKIDKDDTFNPLGERFIRFKLNGDFHLGHYRGVETVFFPSDILNLLKGWEGFLKYFRTLSAVSRHEWFERYYWGVYLLKEEKESGSKKECVRVLKSLFTPLFRAVNIGRWVGETAKYVLFDLFTIWCYFNKLNCWDSLFLFFENIAKQYNVSFQKLLLDIDRKIERTDLLKFFNGRVRVAGESKTQLKKFLRYFSSYKVSFNDLLFDAGNISSICERSNFLKSNIDAKFLLAILNNDDASLGNFDSDLQKFNKNRLQRVYLMVSESFPKGLAEKYAEEFKQKTIEFKEDAENVLIKLPTSDPDSLNSALKNLNFPIEGVKAILVQETYKPLILAMLSSIPIEDEGIVLIRSTREVSKEEIGYRKVYTKIDPEIFKILSKGE